MRASTHNVISNGPAIGTIRDYRPEVQDLAKRRLREICDGIAATMGVTVEIGGQIDLAPTLNDPDATRFAVSVARKMSGEGRE